MALSRSSQQSLLERLDPISKLVATLCIAMLAMHWDEPLWLGIMLLTLIGIARFGAYMSWSKLGHRMLFIAKFGVPLMILTAVAARSDGAVMTTGPLQLSVGALAAVAMVTLRLFCLFLSSLVYMETTDPKDFVVIMTTRLKLPYRFVFGVSMALTFLPLLAEERKVSTDARKIRFGREPRGRLERLRIWLGSLYSVFAGAIRRVEQTAGAMDVKGFGAYPKRTYLREVNLEPAGIWLIGLSSLVTALLWFL